MNKELIHKLESLVQKDIYTRNKIITEGRLYGVYEEEMKRVHVNNAKSLDEIIDKYGWPGISEVGLDGSRAAWLIAQHSICTPDLQRKFLKYLSESEERGEATKKQVAWLTDRIRFNEGKPQVYGTVYDWNESGELYCEVEEPERVDQLRESIGLPPFKQSLEQETIAIEKEGGGPPENYEEYKQAAKAWAKSVGWQ